MRLQCDEYIPNSKFMCSSVHNQANVPTAFYETYFRPIFAAHRAFDYVLPEVKTVQLVFGSYDVSAAHGSVPANLR